MSVAFDGIGTEVLTFQGEGIQENSFAIMSENQTVQRSREGTAPVGLVLNCRGGHVAVQVRGYIQTGFSVSAPPKLGWNQMVCNDRGGLRSATPEEIGRACLVVDMNAETHTMGLFL